ncbi:hypothetical protein ACFE04_023471 [Oxalis oulophora]
MSVLTSELPLLHLKLYIAIAILSILFITFTSLCILFLCIRSSSNRSPTRVKHTSSSSGSIPLFSKEIIEVKVNDDLQDEVKIGNVDLQMLLKIEEGSGGDVAGDHGDVALSLLSVEVDNNNNNIGWGRWYSYKEIEISTRGFSEENVIGEGGYGVVYRGVLNDGTVVAVKNLLNNKGQAEKEFKVEVEAIGKVRHKNLVGLLGYCAEGPQRMLVYEYINNGNLEEWLHGDVGPVSPLTWDIRMQIAIGTAKGYVSPEYASTGLLNEWSDVYSFGVLLMEIITGRSPIDYSRPPGEMNLVEWFKGMVSSRRGEEVIDPLIEVEPPQRALKRVLLVCLRCIDLDSNKRPKMGQIVHMLEADDFPYRAEPRPVRDNDPSPLHTPLHTQTRRG